MYSTGHQLKWMGAVLALAITVWHGSATSVDAAAAPAVPDTAADPASVQVAAEHAAPETTSQFVSAAPGPDALATPESEPLTPDSGPPPEQWEASYFLIMAKLGLGLGLVVLLAWGAVAILRRTALGQQYGAAGSAIKVFERAYLGPKKQICLVAIGGRTLAVGVTDQQITMLAEWDTDELAMPPEQAPGPGFAGQLRRLLDASPGTTMNQDGEA
jgi:flagellar biosynthetic protein FliO